MESENIRRTFAFAEKHNKPVVCLKAAHMPLEKASSLAQASGKQFEGMLSHFVACEGMPIMILSNLAPQFGLFNGATCTFKGLLYLPDNADVQITKKDFQNLKLSGTTLQTPLDLPTGSYGFTQFHQLPIHSILVAINDKLVTSAEDITAAITHDTNLKCRFHLPKQPPALPDFVVVQCDAYQQRGGTNILGIHGLTENLIPIPCQKVLRNLPTDKSKGNKA